MSYSVTPNVHIKELLDLDSKTRDEFLTSLEFFLDSNGSYKLASQQLFITRQTLYYRINKIKNMLGNDFLQPPKRLAIEFSIKAYRYLQKDERTIS